MSKAWNILKYFGLFTGLVTTLWGVFKLVDTIQDNQVQNQQNHQIVMTELTEIKTDVDSLYSRDERRDNSESEIKVMIEKTEGRLIYYIRHSNEMTNEQILDAFELGFERGKKKELTLSDMRDGTP